MHAHKHLQAHANTPYVLTYVLTIVHRDEPETQQQHSDKVDPQVFRVCC